MTNSIEPWKLTAYALGELDTEETQQVRDAIEADPALQSQLQEMQSVIARIQSAIQHSPSTDGLTENQTANIADHIQNTTSQPSTTHENAVALSNGASKTTGSAVRLSRSAVWGLLALAASLLVAILFIPAGMNSRKLASNLRIVDVTQLGDRDGESTLRTRTDPAQTPVVQYDLEAEATAPLGRTEFRRKSGASTSPKDASDPDGYAKYLPASDPSKRSEVELDLVVENMPRQDGAKQTQWAGQDPSDAKPNEILPGSGTVAAPTGPVVGIQAGTNLSLYKESARGGLYNEYAAAPASGGMGGGTLRIISTEEEVSKVTGITKNGAGTLTLNAPDDVVFLDKQSYHLKKSGDRYEPIVETPFVTTEQAPLSTFSIDVDTASYSKIRQYLMQANQLPQPNAVRIEELVNYFEYDYEGPTDEHPFASNMAVHTCPWNEDHKLVRIGLQAKKIDVKERTKANLVFLLDVSGSMDEPNKLPLVKQAISMLVRQLGENDRIAMVVYAGAAGCVLPSITGDRQAQILAALEELNAGGSTNGGQGIELAYSIAREHFIPGGINRVILCTDGDFNVGTTSNDALVKLVQEQAKSKVFLTCLGFGIGNYNDSMMEMISNQGNGVYGMVDNALEARRLMIEQLSGTLITVAKDVKIQVEFNPTKIASYRLIGYENRRLANEDFNNDKKDAGDIGAGHRVTALYEIVPVGVTSKEPVVDELRYRAKKKAEPKSETESGKSLTFADEWITLKLRYKQPEGDVSSKVEFFLTDEAAKNAADDSDFRWSSAVAEFGLLLRRSQLAPQADWGRMIERARSSTGDNSYRIECLEMMTKAKSLIGQ